jgi:hypothetical protein
VASPREAVSCLEVEFRADSKHLMALGIIIGKDRHPMAAVSCRDRSRQLVDKQPLDGSCTLVNLTASMGCCVGCVHSRGSASNTETGQLGSPLWTPSSTLMNMQSQSSFCVTTVTCILWLCSLYHACAAKGIAVFLEPHSIRYLNILRLTVPQTIIHHHLAVS